jgi:hypothetical protein
MAPRSVPGRPWPVRVLASSETATTGTVAAVTMGGILYVISLYLSIASFIASARTCDKKNELVLVSAFHAVSGRSATSVGDRETYRAFGVGIRAR